MSHKTYLKKSPIFRYWRGTCGWATRSSRLLTHPGFTTSSSQWRCRTSSDCQGPWSRVSGPLVTRPRVIETAAVLFAFWRDTTVPSTQTRIIARTATFPALIEDNLFKNPRVIEDFISLTDFWYYFNFPFLFFLHKISVK